ncbi:pyridoxamine 5'-phosphate oxidase family protein [Candidatus Bathyarchaeota archaeon]|nr:pyridoxamine 5'-phosphate oxidase family protein [Candidatus Bathyarchaeota archaeon]
MAQIELPYDELKQGLAADLLKHGLMVLATCDGGRVYARTVITVFDGLTVYVIAKKDSRKYKQIEVNPHVALAEGSFQIEGVASLQGPPRNEGNLVYLDRFKAQQPKLFESQDGKGNFDNPNMRVIKIEPYRVAYYVQRPIADESYLNVLEPEKKKAYKWTREKDQF